MKKSILMSVGLSTLLLSSPVLAKTNHINLNVSPITGNQTSVNGKTVKLATVKVLHNKTVVGKSVASKNGTFKVSLKTPVKNGWKYTVQVTKKGFTPKKYTVTALYASTKTQPQNNDYQNEIHDLQNNIVSLQSQLNDLKNKQNTTTVINSDNAQTANTWLGYQKQIDALNNQESLINNQLEQLDADDNGGPLPTAQYDVNFYQTHTLSGLTDKLTEYQNKVSNDNKALVQNQNDYTDLGDLQFDTSDANDAQKDINKFNQIKSDITSDGGVDAYLNNARTKQSEYDKLNAELNSLNKQIDDLTQKQSAVLNSLS